MSIECGHQTATDAWFVFQRASVYLFAWNRLAASELSDGAGGVQWKLWLESENFAMVLLICAVEKVPSDNSCSHFESEATLVIDGLEHRIY